MTITEQAVMSIVSNYTNHPKVGLKSKLADLRIGPLDAESIRMDLEDKYSIDIEASERMKWKKVKHLVSSVKCARIGIAYG